MNETIKKLWKYLDGKKTVISSFYWGTGSAIILVLFPSGLPEPYLTLWMKIGGILTAMGLGHKFVKGLDK